MQTALILLNQNDCQKGFDPRKIRRKHPKNQLKLHSFVASTPKASRPNKSPQATQLGIGDFRSKQGQGTSNGSSNFPWRMRAAISSKACHGELPEKWLEESRNHWFQYGSFVNHQGLGYQFDCCFWLGDVHALEQKYYSQAYNVFAIIAKLPLGTWFKDLKTLCFNATCWYAGFHVWQGL